MKHPRDLTDFELNQERDDLFFWLRSDAADSSQFAKSIINERFNALDDEVGRREVVQSTFFYDKRKDTAAK